MPKETENYSFKKPLYSEQADIQIINENMDLLDAGAARKKDRILYLTESQEFTIPDGVYEIDIYLVNGGCDGAAGSKNTGSSNYRRGAGGAGGAGGGGCFIPAVKVNPGESYNVNVGAVGGGITSFGAYIAPAMNVAGGAGSSQKDGENGKIPVMLDYVEGGRCPLDGQVYGVSGASGGYCAANDTSWKYEAGKGGAAAVVTETGITPPRYGTKAYASYTSTDTNGYIIIGGGGGGSFDNPGEDGTYGNRNNNEEFHSGKGGDATTYGCGGGGGGGGNSYMEPAAGGKGVQGVCIIAY